MILNIKQRSGLNSPYSLFPDMEGTLYNRQSSPQLWMIYVETVGILSPVMLKFLRTFPPLIILTYC